MNIGTIFDFFYLLKNWINKIKCFHLPIIHLFSFFKGTSIYLFIYLLSALGLRCCAQAFSSLGERGLLFVVVRGLLVAEHGLWVRGLQ